MHHESCDWCNWWAWVGREAGVELVTPTDKDQRKTDVQLDVNKTWEGLPSSWQKGFFRIFVWKSKFGHLNLDWLFYHVPIPLERGRGHSQSNHCSPTVPPTQPKGRTWKLTQDDGNWGTKIFGFGNNSCNRVRDATVAPSIFIKCQRFKLGPFLPQAAPRTITLTQWLNHAAALKVGEACVHWWNFGNSRTQMTQLHNVLVGDSIPPEAAENKKPSNQCSNRTC